jgi:hypothetical protein
MALPLHPPGLLPITLQQLKAFDIPAPQHFVILTLSVVEWGTTPACAFVFAFGFWFCFYRLKT